MNAIKADKQQVHPPGEPTPTSAWRAAAATEITDGLLEWPPDVFALTDVVLARSGAYRFAMSQHADTRWPPEGRPDWPCAVEEAGREWGVWAEGGRGAVPGLIAEMWGMFCQRAETPLEQLAEGGDWPMRTALLILHATADEACAGLGVALGSSSGDGCVYRARARELLATTGSLARICTSLLRVLPKVRTPLAGSSLSSVSRYACVVGPDVETRWHKTPARHPGTDPHTDRANLLLLPWPLRVRESDFRVLEGSVRMMAREPCGFFEFAPSDPLDLDLVDRVLAAARNEADSVDVVMLPESAVDEADIENLESLLDRHGVIGLVAGVRQRSRQPGCLPGNWVHTGISPRLEKGGPPPSSPGGQWFHIRQDKHHRWSLNESQVNQYHLGGALHPRIRWWEAVDMPRPKVRFVEVGELTLVALVCEDLAQSDNVAQVIRSVGPTLLFTPLLDGPQLASRWSARYAGVCADDPGSAVLTLTSAGMVERSRPHGRDASNVVALWKYPAGGGGIREIPLEPGAQGILLTTCGDTATRRSSDGRWPVQNAIDYFDVAVYQVRASTGATRDVPPTAATTPRVLETDELTVLTGWAEGAAEALAYAPERAAALLADARPGASWRAALGIPPPSARLTKAIECMARALAALPSPADAAAFDAVLTATWKEPPGELELDGLARRVLRSALEQLRVHQARQAASSASTMPGR